MTEERRGWYLVPDRESQITRTSTQQLRGRREGLTPNLDQRLFGAGPQVNNRNISVLIYLPEAHTGPPAQHIRDLVFKNIS